MTDFNETLRIMSFNTYIYCTLYPKQHHGLRCSALSEIQIADQVSLQFLRKQFHRIPCFSTSPHVWLLDLFLKLLFSCNTKRKSLISWGSVSADSQQSMILMKNNLPGKVNQKIHGTLGGKRCRSVLLKEYFRTILCELSGKICSNIAT